LVGDCCPTYSGQCAKKAKPKKKKLLQEVVVTVDDPVLLLRDILGYVVDHETSGPNNILPKVLRRAIESLEKGQTTKACNAVDSSIKLIRALGAQTISVLQLNDWTTLLLASKTELGC
jgi:hypothetical protein